MKSSLRFYKKNKEERLNHKLPSFQIYKGVFLLLFLISNSLCYSEEFVQFSSGNSQFKIDMPTISSSDIIKIDNQYILDRFGLYNVSNFAQLSAALDDATGGEVIVVRKSIRDKHLHYKQKHPYTSPVLIIGMLDGGNAPFLDDITWENLHNVTITHFKIKNLRSKSRYNYSWQIRNANNVRLTNLHFSGKANNLIALKSNNIGAILSNQSGLLIKQSKNIIIDRTLFTDLFHAVEFSNLDYFHAIANKSIRIASDMFSGGGVRNALFDSNLSHTRTPVYYNHRGNKRYVHSDMIQLYTTGMKRNNADITIRNNVSLVGDTPLTNRHLSGWQCFFTRDESGDSVRHVALPYYNVKIINNICASNQHHGVTLSRGNNNVLAGNFVLLVDKGRTSREATGSIKVFDNKNCKILGNVANEFEFNGLSNCQNINNINSYKPDYDKTIIAMRQAIKSAKKRLRIEPASSSNDLSRFYKNEGLQAHPLQFLDYSKLTLVPSF